MQAEQDEHLAKFPPFKGPRTGGNFEVDENVVAGEHLKTHLTVTARHKHAAAINLLTAPQLSPFQGPKLSLPAHMATRSGAAPPRSSAERPTAPQ